MNERAPLEPMLGGLLRKPVGVIVNQVYQALLEAGYTDLRPSYMIVFQTMSTAGDRITTLAERAQLTKQSMGYLINHLEAHGYVERTVDPLDQRAWIIRRTERGWGVEQTAMEVVNKIEQEWGDHIGKENMKTLLRLLYEINTLIGEA